ncbi:MAG: hypothetical protein KAG04_00575, partial [Mycoplasmataceae bacterium]|nr:hypothetical protein [Mycoplasmataceae bacterium]
KNKSVLIADNEDVVAYTYPFDFNKIFRTRILVESGKLKRLVNVNSRFSIEYVYKAFLVSETYSTSKKAIITSRSLGSSTFNPLKIKRQWTSFEKLLKENYNGKFHPEISYARIFHEMVFLFSFAGVSKNKVLIAKLKKDFEKTLKAEFEDFFITNRYMLIKNKETDLLRKNDTPAKLTKVYKSISNG